LTSGVFFADEHERFGIHEAADVVNVAVRVVAHRAFGQPEDVFDAEIIFQRRFDFAFCQAGVADLDPGIEVTFLGGEQRAAAVHLDAAAFDDEGPAAAFGVEKFLAQHPRGGFGTLVSLRQLWYLAQPLKWKWTMAVSDFGLWALDFGLRFTKIGPLSRVQPRLVGCTTNWIFFKLQPARWKRGGELFLGLVPDEQADDFAGGNLSHHFAVDPRMAVEFARPVGGVVRPAEPGGLVRFPFGGHREAEFERG
jgi:hypothetical protein